VVKSEPVDPADETSLTTINAPSSPAQQITPSKPPRDLSLRKKRNAVPLPTSLFIGDLRLTVLRTRLQNLTPPIPAEFAGSGILICGPGVLALANNQEGKIEGSTEGPKAGSIVAVRKGEKGVEIEGSVGGVYDLVRKEVYGSFAQVSA
jgi:cleavage and polyadenylation specificity factor subunit 2